MVNEIRRRTDESLRGMRAVLQGLGGIEGPKSVILVSAGMVFDSLGGETDELAELVGS